MKKLVLSKKTVALLNSNSITGGGRIDSGALCPDLPPLITNDPPPYQSHYCPSQDLCIPTFVGCPALPQWSHDSCAVNSCNILC